MYDAARKGAAVALLGERGVLAVTGPDRKKLLHNILSNDVLACDVGQGCLAALMDVKGRVLALMRVVVTRDAVLLEAPLARLPIVEATLNHYKVAAPVRIAARPASVIALLGPGAPAALAAAGAPLPLDAPGAHAAGAVAGAEILVARAADLPAAGLVVHTAPSAADAVAEALRRAGGSSLDRATLDVLRIEDGTPWYGPDVTEENLLHETGLLRLYHSPSKGCYVGQEVVARLEGRGGHVNKQLRGLRLAAPAPAGTALTDPRGGEVGRVTTSGISPLFGPVALAYVHRSHAETGTVVSVAGAEAIVADLPLTEGPVP
jgi:tRNA-modifying protein YgfZ